MMTIQEEQARLTDIAMRALELACRNDVLGKDRPTARALGQEAHDVGGVEAMRVVYRAIEHAWRSGYVKPNKEHLDPADGFHPAVFQAAWDGVGEWLW